MPSTQTITKRTSTDRRAQPPVKLTTPVSNAAFGKFVADKAKPAVVAPVPMPATPVKPTLVEHNGCKEYTPGTIGARIWAAADAIQAATPNTPVVATAVYVALPNVNHRSINAGLSHWRKFNGTLHVKSA